MSNTILSVNNGQGELVRKKVTVNLFAAMFYVCAYVFDEVLNGFLGTNFAGSLILLLYGFLLNLMNGNVNGLMLSKWSIVFFLSVVVVSLVAFMSPSGCSIEAKGVVSLLLAGLLVIYFHQINFSRIVTDQFFSKAALYFILFLLFLDVLGIGVRGLLFGSSKYSGPYSEPSHLAIYLLPIVAFRLLVSPRDKLAWLVLIIGFVLASSSTLLVGTIGVIALNFIRHASYKNKRSVLFFLLLFLIAAVSVALGVVDMTHTLDRIEHIFVGYEADSADHTNLSSIVWLNGWSQAYQTFIETSWLGTGFNQMGCGKFYEFGILSPLMIETSGIVLNANDGSLFAAKLIAELGVFGLFVVLGLTLFSFLSIFRLRRSVRLINAHGSFCGVVKSVGALCVLSYLFIRGMGYFQLPFLVALSMLFSSSQKINYIKK